MTYKNGCLPSQRQRAEPPAAPHRRPGGGVGDGSVQGVGVGAPRGAWMQAAVAATRCDHCKRAGASGRSGGGLLSAEQASLRQVLDS